MNSLFDITDELRQITLEDFELKKKRNSRISLRGYSRLIEVQSSFLSKFFNGKTLISKDRAKNLIERLEIPEKRKIELLSKLDISNPLDRNMLLKKNYYLIADPMYYSLLCLIETNDFIFDSENLAKQLQRTEGEIKYALNLLIELNYISISDSGKFEVATPHLIAHETTSNDSLTKRHKNNLNFAMEALDKLDLKDMFFGFETIAINKDNISKFKKLANDFLDQVTTLSNATSNKDEVYEFNVNFYPRILKNQLSKEGIYEN